MHLLYTCAVSVHMLTTVRLLCANMSAFVAMQDLYPPAAQGIGAYPSRNDTSRSTSQPPTHRAAPAQDWSSRSKSFTTQAQGRGHVARNEAGEAADGMAAQAVDTIRAGMRQRGAHGGLAMERVLQVCRERCSGVGARRSSSLH